MTTKSLLLHDSTFLCGGALFHKDSLLERLALLCYSGVFPDFAGVFAGDFDGPPHVPAGYRAPGAPALAEPGELLGLGDAALAIREREAFLHAVVVDGEHVRASEAENQEHFDGPGADAAHR